MALRTVTKQSAGSIRYTSKFQTGETVEGYFMGTKAGVTKNPKWKAPLVLILQTAEGQTLDVYASGSLAYVENNAQQDPSQALIVGQLTKITKTGSYVNKQGRDFPTFSIQQDDEKILSAGTITLPAPTLTSSTTIEERLEKARRMNG